MRSLSCFEGMRRKAFDIIRWEETGKHELKSILWECTLRCNLSCGHCGSDCKKVCDVPDADEKLFFSALQDIKTRYDSSKVFIGITGGEPLMRSDLEAIISTVRSMCFRVGIVTNGFAMTPRRFLALVQAGLCSMTVSLDGLEDQHNALRGNPDSFGHAMTAIGNAASFIRQSKTPFDFDVVTCVNPGNIGTLSRLQSLLWENGVRHWRLFSIFPSGRACDERFNLDQDSFREMMDFIAQCRKRNLDVSYSCEGWLGSYELKVRPTYYFCRAGITNAGIFVDGRVGGCISARSPDFIAGDLKEKSFLDIWDNGFGVLRDRSWAKKGNCGTCPDWKHCLGNGLHLYKDMASGPARCSRMS